MSRTIDERVVSMQFDNRQFERNVSTTMSTLDKLKAKLKLSDASKGLDGLSKAAKKCDLAPLSRATETVGLRFNAMYTMADQALRRITDSAYRAGVNITKSLTIDPVKMGFQEYETQLNAIQTILANTQSKGSTLEDVNAALGELNTYADKTIYNFTEMTRNIGTFTAAGVDLDKSVSSIKGIANLAAVSGSTSQQASTAMYQLSQALASGTVKLMDWNSVVNAGMGGQLFQDALKRTAKQMGHNVDEMIKKYGSFRESLSKGEWLTAEVLTETLTQLSGAYSEADLIAQGYSEKQAKEIAELAETAVNAATKVKTFTQLLDTLKEAAQSGWTQTWQLIIGDFEEAKELWTKVSDVVGGFINKMSESRNNLLEGALVSKWDKLLEKLNEAGVSSEEFEDKVRKTTKEHGQDLDALIKKYGTFEKAIRSGEVSADTLKKALKGVNEQGADLSLVKGTVKRGQKGDQVKQIEGALKALGYDLVGKQDGKNYSDDGYFGTLTEDAIKDFQKLQGLKVTGIVDEETLNALKKATTRTSELTESVFDLVDGVTELGGRELLLESFANLFHGLKTVMAPIAGAFKEIFSPITSEGLYGFLEGFRDLTAKMRLNAPQIVRLKNTFKGLFSVIDIV
jgi:tape measure domain-containing protein